MKRSRIKSKEISNTSRFFLGIICLLFFAPLSCFSQNPVNKFSDPVVREIHDLKDRRDSTALLPYLRDSNPNYRGEALMSFGSIQCASLIDSIAPSLESEFNGIRMAAAFALGQTFHSDAVPHISSTLEKDTVKLVRGMLYDALGKTGNRADLQWLAGQNADYQEAEGQAQGILRFALRGITSPEGNTRMIKIFEEGTSSVGLIYAAYHLGRYADTVWLMSNVEVLEELYRSERDPVIASNLISAIIKGRNNEAWPAVEIVLKSDVDYREKVNTIRTLNRIVWEDAKGLLYKLAGGEDSNLAVASAETIVRFARESDMRNHLKAIDKATNWRARALLLGKAMELSSAKKNLPEKVKGQILDLYNKSENLTEKAWLLKSLASQPEEFKFVEQEMNSISTIVRTYAMETLTMMVKHNNFDRAREIMASGGVDLDEEFMRIFKSGIQSGEIAMVSLSAVMFRDSELGYKNKISDFGFMEQALEQAQAPNMAEAKNELISSLNYLTGVELEDKTSPTFNHPIDWDRVIQIPPRQLVNIVTNKGVVVVQMNVNWCPGTVSAFLELARSGFYDKKAIHRVVPNFLVQDGCPQGDGWGGPPFSIRSEFTPAPFLEGTFGMASAGKDTEGSQWYFTHTATPHLDGKYTKFGSVVSGIEIVHQLEAGDIIERIIVIKESR